MSARRAQGTTTPRQPRSRKRRSRAASQLLAKPSDLRCLLARRLTIEVDAEACDEPAAVLLPRRRGSLIIRGSPAICLGRTGPLQIQDDLRERAISSVDETKTKAHASPAVPSTQPVLAAVVATDDNQRSRRGRPATASPGGTGVDAPRCSRHVAGATAPAGAAAAGAACDVLAQARSPGRSSERPTGAASQRSDSRRPGSEPAVPPTGITLTGRASAAAAPSKQPRPQHGRFRRRAVADDAGRRRRRHAPPTA